MLAILRQRAHRPHHPCASTLSRFFVHDLLRLEGMHRIVRFCVWIQDYLHAVCSRSLAGNYRMLSIPWCLERGHLPWVLTLSLFCVHVVLRHEGTCHIVPFCVSIQDYFH